MTVPSSSRVPAPQVLVFDLDDTLYLERDFAFSGFAAVEAHLQARHDDAVLPGTCRTLFEQGVRGDIFNQALHRFGLDAHEGAIKELVDIYRRHVPNIAPCPDTLRLLAASDLPRAIITDGPEHMQRTKISALGIACHFGLIVPTGGLPEGMGKPHPRAFEIVMEWSGKPAPAHVYIADNPAKDFLAPSALGWRTVQIDREGRIHTPVPPSPGHAAEARIESLDELAAVLQAGP